MHASLPLFRQEALEAQRTSALGEVVLVRPLSFSFLAAAAAGIAACIVLFLIFGTYTRRTTIEGMVVPDSGIAKVYARQAGIVVARHVSEGQLVKKGQALYTVSTDLQSATRGQAQAALAAQTRARKSLLEQEIENTKRLQQNERETLQAKIENLRTELARTDEQLRARRERVAITVDASDRYQQLLSRGFVSKDQAERRVADVLDQQSGLRDLERQRASIAQSLVDARSEMRGLTPKYSNQLSQMSRGVIDAEQDLVQTEARRQIVITAPQDGVVTALMVEAGQMADATKPLASIISATARWEAHLLVPSSAAGFVRAGTPVHIRYEAYPYQKFGQYKGTVRSIARTAFAPAEFANEGGFAANPNARSMTYYRVTVALEKQAVAAYGQLRPLQAGMSLQADLLQEKRRLYEWVLEPLYSLSGSL